MKIILLVDVPKVGKRHEVKEVADGFARNVLLPAKKAVVATPEMIAKNKQDQDQKAQSIAHEDQVFLDLIKKLREVDLTIMAKSGKGGHLFASIKADEIVASAKALGFDLKKDWIIISEPIKTVGEHQIELKRGGKSEKIKLVVVA
ncbi:MAG: 50S ribosomal protein L9 [Candidatus Paceibacterota bacterium]|jgi:large subunit ribosomal protein L9